MKKQALTAVLLTAALAMGTAPAAFAANINDETEAGTIDTKTGVGNTTVKVQTVATNISATLPLSIQVVGPAEGGDLSAVPSNYSIVNNSVYPLKVSKVEAAPGTGWGIASASLTNASTSTSDVGDIFMELSMGSSKVTLKAADQEPSNWIIPAKAEDGTSATINVNGSVSQIKSVSKDAVTALTVTYTVEATTASAK